MRRSGQSHSRLVAISRHGDNLQVALDLVEIPLSFNLFSKEEDEKEKVIREKLRLGAIAHE